MMAADSVRITAEPLNVGEIYAQVVHTSTGAVSLFVGTTRDTFEGKKVTRLEYEAYEPMALKKLTQLCGKVRSKWPDVHNVAVYHRVGVVGPAEASVVIAVTSPHRQTSLQAVAFAIDDLKATVPIWKKEMYEDGSAWKENKECEWATGRQQQPEETEEGQLLQQPPPTVDPALVQIHASNEEIDRRIDAFIQRKREENNASNVLEFCGRHAKDTADEFSCARTDSVLVRKQTSASAAATAPAASASHLRKSVVDNTGWGPDYDKGASGAAAAAAEAPRLAPDGVQERVKNLEDHLALGSSVKPVPKDFYARLKDIEDRVMFLEGVSPEYFPMSGQQSFGNNNPSFAPGTGDGGPPETRQQKEYKEKLSQSLSTINKRIQELQAKLSKPSS